MVNEKTEPPGPQFAEYLQLGQGVQGPISTGSGGGDQYPVSVSMSRVDVTVHPVLKEQLARFMELTHNPWRERFWALVGAAVAVSPSAGEALCNAYIFQPPIPMSILHQLEVLIFGMSMFGAVLIKLFIKPRETEAQALYDQIMSRRTEKVSVGK